MRVCSDILEFVGEGVEERLELDVVTEEKYIPDARQRLYQLPDQISS